MNDVPSMFEDLPEPTEEEWYSMYPSESCSECDFPLRFYFDEIAKETVGICDKCGLTETSK